MPNLRTFAKGRYTFLGPVLPFDPKGLPEKKELKDELRKEIDFGDGPLIVCSAGGTSVGLPLLELCRAAFSFISHEIPDARMLIVTGPRINPRRLEDISKGAEKEGLVIRPFVPRLYRYFAAADVCIVQAGGMTTAELTALDTPFFYFPLEGHSEQENHIGTMLEQCSFGERLRFKVTSPYDLARKVIGRIKASPESGRARSGAPRRGPDGAHRAAELIGKLILSA